MSPTVTPADLKAFRKDHNLSQTALADRLLVSRRNIENWESGTREPPAHLRLALFFVDQIEQAKTRVKLMEEGAYSIGRDNRDITQEVIEKTRANIADYEALVANFKAEK